MRERTFRALPLYIDGLRRARNVFRRFKETRRAFAEAIALDYLHDLQRDNYTQTILVHGKPVTFRLVDFHYSSPATLKDDPMEWVPMTIRLPYAETAERDEAFLVKVQAELDYRRAHMGMPITTYSMEPHALIASAIRMKAAVLTAHWKLPVGLKIARVHKPSKKTVPRRPLYK